MPAADDDDTGDQPRAEPPVADAPTARPRLRDRFETLVLGLGAAGIAVAVTLMAIHRLENTDNSPAEAVRPTVPSVATTPATPATPPRPSGDEERQAVTRLAVAGHPIYCGGGTQDMVALTFEGGPGPETHNVVRRLRSNDLRATFFLVGGNLKEYGDRVAPALEFGAVGNNTQTHPKLTTLSKDRQQAEIVGAQKAIAKVAGRPVRLFRPPDGERDAGVDGIVQRAGMVEVLWSVDSGDAADVDAAAVRKTVIGGLRPGAIIRLHDNRGATVRALPAILHAIKDRGFRAVSVPELLTVDPPTRRQLRIGRGAC